MWLDVTLGGIVLVAAFRGWFQGFVSQALRVGELVACIYLAQPVRDYAKPHVLPYLPAIPAELVDRVLWWVSAVVCFVVMSAVASVIIRVTRQPEIPGLAQAGRNDQFAGFMLGVIKGALAAAFLTAGIERYGPEQAKRVPWAQEQLRTSWALKWSDKYQPVPKIWASQPVQHLVNQIIRMGLRKPGEPAQSPHEAEAEDDFPTVRTASRPLDPDRTRGARRVAQPSASSRTATSSSSSSETRDLPPE